MFSRSLFRIIFLVTISCIGLLFLAEFRCKISTIDSHTIQSLLGSYPAAPPRGDVDGKYTISAPGIRASFVPYGASVSNLYINDTRGIERDIVVGFDNASYYTFDGQHGHWGSVPGRYANRIKNATFKIDDVSYNVSANEHDGLNSLHGGIDGWDYRNFTVVNHTRDSITFSIFDPDGTSGYPGDVLSYITYTLSEMSWHIKMVATATTKKTPIMLSSHTYWNLDGYQNPRTSTALNHTLSMPYSNSRVVTDSILIPNGTLAEILKGTVNDFWSSTKTIGYDLQNPSAVDNCGLGCTGYDTCFLIDRENPSNWRGHPVATLTSGFTGIQLSVYTDQEAIQIYSCNGQNGSLALKSTQGLDETFDRPRSIPQYGCVVMEVEDWIDAINHPEWQRDERTIFGPNTDPYVLEATYNFSLLEDSFHR